MNTKQIRIRISTPFACAEADAGIARALPDPRPHCVATSASCNRFDVPIIVPAAGIGGSPAP